MARWRSAEVAAQTPNPFAPSQTGSPYAAQTPRQTVNCRHPVGCVLWRTLIRGLTVSRMSETPTPPGPSEPPAAPPPPPGGYSGPPVSGQVAPPGYANNDEKTWSLIAHFGGAITGFIAPLIVFLVKGNESPTVRAHAVASLNFQILWNIISFVSVIIGSCLIFLILPGILYFVPIFPFVMAIIGGIKANEGVLYKYPMSIELIK
jgi:uncharacterized protein